MNWQEISGNSILMPEKTIGIIHFLGGAFVASAPQYTYRWLLEELAKAGYTIIATPFVNSLDHTAIARQVLNRFENILSRLKASGAFAQQYLPIYGLGHSMGCKLHLLIGSMFTVERAGNILISFNNYSASRAIPLVEQLEITSSFNIEFTPSPRETDQLILKSYSIRRNLLIKFAQDEIDQTLTLNPLLEKRFPNMVATLQLPGNHLTPLGQELNWSIGEVFTPVDALAQWFKQGFQGDVSRLKKELLRWLNPTL